MQDTLFTPHGSIDDTFTKKKNPRDHEIEMEPGDIEARLYVYIYIKKRKRIQREYCREYQEDPALYRCPS